MSDQEKFVDAHPPEEDLASLKKMNYLLQKKIDELEAKLEESEAKLEELRAQKSPVSVADGAYLAPCAELKIGSIQVGTVPEGLLKKFGRR